MKPWKVRRKITLLQKGNNLSFHLYLTIFSQIFADCEHVQNEKRQENCDSLRRNAVFGDYLERAGELLVGDHDFRSRSRCLFEIEKSSTALVSDVLD